MKRIDKAMEVKDMTYKDKITKEILNACDCDCKDELIATTCPVEVGGPELDERTKVTQYPHRSYLDIVGCRGITCEECWNLEVES